MKDAAVRFKLPEPVSLRQLPSPVNLRLLEGLMADEGYRGSERAFCGVSPLGYTTATLTRRPCSSREECGPSLHQLPVAIGQTKRLSGIPEFFNRALCAYLRRSLSFETSRKLACDI